jgi:hypothetical protein
MSHSGGLASSLAYLFTAAPERAKIVAKLGSGRGGPTGYAYGSQSARKPIHRAHKLDAWIDRLQIDLRAREFDLSVLTGFVHINVPRAWPSVGAIAPSIASPFQLTIASSITSSCEVFRPVVSTSSKMPVLVSCPSHAANSSLGTSLRRTRKSGDRASISAISTRLVFSNDMYRPSIAGMRR